MISEMPEKGQLALFQPEGADYTHHITTELIPTLKSLEYPKGGPISESYCLWLQNLKQCARNYPEHLLFMWIELTIV